MMSLKVKMILLVVGGIIMSVLIMNALYMYQIITWDIYLFVMLACYPLAIVYGRNIMVDIFYGIKLGRYQLFKTKYSAKWKNTILKTMNTVVAALTTVFVGWIYGVYTAYQKYMMHKGIMMK